MSLTIDKLRAMAAQPAEGIYRVRYRGRPADLLARHAQLARRAGLDRLYLVLSFDCDTTDDAAVVEGLHAQLTQLGVPAAYAVPGELLERGADAYRAVAQAGGEFLNHGYREHTVRDPSTGTCHSTLFYDQLSEDDVIRDIEGGHRAVRDVLGVAPDGFRVPHFGTYQSPRSLRFLHRVLASLGYRYSTSTVPLWGLRRGPVFDDFGLIELPVSGMASAPMQILDTWSCWAAPDRTLAPADYAREGTAVGRALAERGSGVLNFYADPSHVHNAPEFMETVRAWAQLAEPISYAELLDRVRGPA